MDRLASTIPRDEGFTLVELLVSLLLFALISLAGVGLVETVIGVQQRTESRGERLAEIQRAFHLITADIGQVSTGPFIDGGTIAFTRNSSAGDYPVIYRYADATLYRQTGEAELPIIEGVNGMTFRFYKEEGGWTNVPFTEQDPSRPKAVELTLSLIRRPNETGGPVRRIVELPDAT